MSLQGEAPTQIPWEKPWKIISTENWQKQRASFSSKHKKICWASPGQEYRLSLCRSNHDLRCTANCLAISFPRALNGSLRAHRLCQQPQFLLFDTGGLRLQSLSYAPHCHP